MIGYTIDNMGDCIAAPGDSGGPVFHRGLHIQRPYRSLDAVGRGTVTEGVLDSPCIAPGVWRTGSYRVGHAPPQRPRWYPPAWRGSLEFYGASLR